MGSPETSASLASLPWPDSARRSLAPGMLRNRICLIRKRAPRRLSVRLPTLVAPAATPGAPGAPPDAPGAAADTPGAAVHSRGSRGSLERSRGRPGRPARCNAFPDRPWASLELGKTHLELSWPSLRISEMPKALPELLRTLRVAGQEQSRGAIPWRQYRRWLCGALMVAPQRDVGELRTRRRAAWRCARWLVPGADLATQVHASGAVLAMLANIRNA